MVVKVNECSKLYGGGKFAITLIWKIASKKMFQFKVLLDTQSK